MRQAALLELRSGGPGSGCQGENCGRPKSGLMKTLEQLRDASKSWNSNNLWVMLAEHGHEGVVSSFSKEELKYLTNYKSQSSCKVGQCFQNAQNIASFDKDRNLKYVEGLVAVYGIPLTHAWVEYNGKVYDPTLASYKSGQEPDYTKGGTLKMSAQEKTPEYVGVVVPKEEIAKHQLKTEMYGPLSHEYKNKALQKKIWGK